MKKLYTTRFYILFLILSAMHLSAQNAWEEINTPLGGDIWNLSESPSGFLFANVAGAGLYRSADNGNSWQLCFGQGTAWLYGNKLAITHDGVLFTSSRNGPLVRSTDNGDTWQEVLSTGSSFSGIVARYDSANSTGNEELYVISGDFMGQLTLHISGDLGETWLTKPSGISTYYGAGRLAVNSQGMLFVATDDTLYRSADAGESWEQTGAGDVVTFLVTPADELLAGFRYSEWLYISHDNGTTWQGLFRAPEIVPLATDSTGLIYASFHKELISISSDATYWSQFNTLPSAAVNCFLVTSSGDLYAGSDDIYKSTDGGLTWHKSGNGIYDHNYSYITTLPNGDLYIYSDSLYASSDEGLSYRTVKDDNNPANYFKRVYYHPDGDIFALGGNLFHNSNILFRSQDNGTTFREVFIMANYLQSGDNNFHITPQGSLLLITNNGILRSTDKGLHWNIVLNDPYIGGAFISPPGVIYFNAYNTLYRSHDDGVTFERVPQDTTRRLMTANQQGHLFALDEDDILWLSADEGNTWQQRAGMPSQTYYYPKIVIDSYGTLYAIALHDGLSRSTDGGMSWQPYNEGIPDIDILNVHDLHVSGDDVIYASYPYGIWQRSAENILKHRAFAQVSTTSQLTVYPNPAACSGTIRVSGTAAAETLRFYDLHGRLVKELSQDGGTAQISLSGLKPGTYLIKAVERNAEGIIVVK